MFQNKITHADVIIFTRQLSTLLRAGISLSSAISTIAEEVPNEEFKIVLKDIYSSINSGESFSTALSKYPDLFSELFVSMVGVGETGGLLDEALDRLAGIYTKEMAIRTKIKSALIYPSVLIFMAIIIVTFVLIAVLPKFAAIFEASQADLPIPTRILLGFSMAIRRLWLPILALVIIAVISFKNYIADPKGRHSFHSRLLKVPLPADIYKKIMTARLCHTLSALLASGIPLLKALSVSENTLPNLVVRNIIRDMRRNMAEGKPMIESFKESSFFSPMVIQMVSTGEKSGKIDEMLAEVASFYEPEIENTINNLTTILEPIMLLAMGIMVAFIALSVLLPIFNLIKVFRG